MPTNRNYRRQERRYNDAHKEVLMRGTTHIKSRAPGFYLSDGTLDSLSVAEAWNELRDELTAQFIVANPGRRPWAWWIFDAPEPTRQLIGGHDAFGDGPVDALVNEIIRHGGGWYCSVGEAEMRDPPIVETQAAYLDRHELLTEYEREALGDFPREEVHQ